MSRILEDQRIDPRIKATFCNFPQLPPRDVPNREALLAGIAQATGPGPLATVLASIDFAAVAPQDGLVVHTEQIESAPDGNRINLLITSLPGDELRPAVYYIHGGGMLTQSCYDANYQALARLIAREGCRVVMVDFRNALAPSSAPEVAPFPAGLNDCVSGLRWVKRNARSLGIDPARIIIAGESGGANLAIATLLSAKRADEPTGLAGLYVLCPYLAGMWEGKPGSSALENAGILMDVRSNFGAMGYGIDAFAAHDPLAWPGFATTEDLKGLPPTIIAVNECDPLRDDGVDFYRKLLIAGVPAQCRELKGTIHGTEIFFCCPDITRDTTRHLAAFARDR